MAKLKKIFLENQITVWRNDLKVPQRFEILEGAGQQTNPTRKSVVELKPGDEIELPSKYDQAIQTVDKKTNRVIGGMAPRLTKVGSTAKLMECLDPEAMELKHNLDDLVKKKMQQEVLDQILAEQANKLKGK